MLLLRLCAKGLTDISHSWVENLLLEFTLLMVVSKTRRGLRLSLKATPAHKCIKVKPSERGLAAFTWQGKAYRYKTCHFGATYSAYWWSRASAMIQRHIHILLFGYHRSFIYVDGPFFLFKQEWACIQAHLLTVYLQVCKVRIS